ncbi:hypothetical protein ACFQY4_39970 [Catellatospora bangladeshensis]|uniref:hypothetical protein n=1 Tax=Catellatospora bangladeshensis TaxID=310355 RepID=UPI003622A21B
MKIVVPSPAETASSVVAVVPVLDRDRSPDGPGGPASIEPAQQERTQARDAAPAQTSEATAMTMVLFLNFTADS